MTAHPVVLAAIAGVCLLPAVPAQAAPCREDRACWLWPVMGDHTRGGVVLHNPGGRPQVAKHVSPCAFRFLASRRFIDWRRTKRLRGDRIAMDPRRVRCIQVADRTRPTPLVVRMDRSVVADLQAWGVPAQPSPIRLVSHLQQVPGRSIAATATTGPDGIAMHRQLLMDLPVLRVVLTHEELHRASPAVQAGLTSPTAVCHEEAAADAVSLDVTRDRLRDAWEVVPPAYPALTRWLRLVSSRATGARWDTPPAAAWRVEFARATAAGRVALAATDPIPCPEETL